MLEVTKITEEYLLKDGDYKIQVKVYQEGHPHPMNGKRLKITDTEGCRDFIFDRSKPEVVKKIGELLIEASKL